MDNPTPRTIYIPLLNEGVTVARPTLGIPLGGDLYRVLPTDDYDPENEEWEFIPGSVVRGVEEWSGADLLLFARAPK